MRKGWQRVNVGDVAKVLRGASPRPKGDPRYYGGNVPRLMVADVTRDGRYVTPKIDSLTDAGARLSRPMPAGTLTIVCSGDVGTPSFLAVDACIHDGFLAVDEIQPSCLPEYLYEVFQSLKARLERSATHGGVFTNLTTEILREFSFDLPPLPEQRKIAEILRTWDEALEKLTALRALNIRRRVWFRTHLFTGKIRLPGFTGEWREVRLSEVLYEHGSSSTGAEEVYSVSVHKGLVNQIEHLGRSFSAANTDHYNRVLPGDIVYTKSPTGDFPLGIIKQSKIDREVIVSPLYGVFTPQTYALGVILDALFESPLASRNYLHPLVQKGAKNTIAVTNGQFLEGKLRLPMDPSEQAAIAEIVKASHAECAGIEAEIEALTRQKRGLMQKLLTGAWRVSTAEATEGAR